MSNAIVSRALELARRHAEWSPVRVLDVAMAGHVETHPDFEVAPGRSGFDDWLSPPSPFAELLLGAFGANLAPEEFHAEAERWHQVIDAFGARYRLWR